MMTYDKYLEHVVDFYEEVLTKKEFENIVDRFNGEEVDLTEYNFYDEDLEQYILSELIKRRFDNIWVDYVDGNEVDIYSNSFLEDEELDEINSILSEYGYNFANYDDMKEDTIRHKEKMQNYKLKDEALDIVENMSVSKLEEFVKKYGN